VIPASIAPSALPPIDQASLPADIRKGTAEEKKAYTAALGFERMLLGELTKQMAETAKPADGDDDTKDAASSMYMQMLPDQLADAVTRNGGIGLARNLYNATKGQA
jgi:Rod binding domain-containing protein